MPEVTELVTELGIEPKPSDYKVGAFIFLKVLFIIIFYFLSHLYTQQV